MQNNTKKPIKPLVLCISDANFQIGILFKLQYSVNLTFKREETRWFGYMRHPFLGKVGVRTYISLTDRVEKSRGHVQTFYRGLNIQSNKWVDTALKVFKHTKQQTDRHHL